MFDVVTDGLLMTHWMFQRYKSFVSHETLDIAFVAEFVMELKCAL